jgi:hypothetical protein
LTVTLVQIIDPGVFHRLQLGTQGPETADYVTKEEE